MTVRRKPGHLRKMLLPFVAALLILASSVIFSGCDVGKPDGNGSGNGFSSAPSSPSASSSGNTGKPVTTAPDFTVTDAEGNAVKLSDFIGKPVVVNFWATWCPPCRAELPDFEEAYRKYGDRVQFLIVNLINGSDDTFASVQKFADNNGYTFPLYYDTHDSAARAYGIRGIPNTYFIRSDGSIAAGSQRMIGKSELEKGIALILE